MIPYIEIKRNQYKRSGIVAVIWVLPFFLVSEIFPRFEFWIGIPMVLGVGVIIVLHRKALSIPPCPACHSECEEFMKSKVLCLKCKACGNTFETDCVIDYVAAIPRKRCRGE